MSEPKSVVCQKCQGRGEDDGFEPCSLCGGRGHVTLEQHRKWKEIRALKDYTFRPRIHVKMNIPQLRKAEEIAKKWLGIFKPLMSDEVVVDYSELEPRIIAKEKKL